jgi:hypothetical protein
MYFDVFPAECMKLVVECLSASFGRGSYCILSLFLCLACVSLSDGHSDQRLLIVMFSLWKYVDVNILVNKTMHRNISLLLSLLFYGCCKTCKKLVSAVSIQNISYSNHKR